MDFLIEVETDSARFGLELQLLARLLQRECMGDEQAVVWAVA